MTMVAFIMTMIMMMFGTRIKGKMSTVTKWGRQLIKMINKCDIKIVNEDQEICKGNKSV